jgi:O-antigen/teichoic acid export membrane protein
MTVKRSNIQASSGQKIIGNTVLSTLSELSLVFTSVYYILVARFLGDTQFGKFGTAIGFVGLFTLLIHFGFSYSIVKVIVKEKEKTGLFVANALYIQFALSLFCFIACMGAASLLKAKYPIEVRQLIAITFAAEMLKCFNLTLRASCKALGEYRYDTIAVNAERFFLLGAGLLFLLSGYGLLTVALLLALSRLISFLLLGMFILKSGYPFFLFPNATLVKTLIKSSFVYVVQSAFWRVYDYIDLVMISLMRPFHEVGWYRAGRQILEGLWFIPNILTEAIYPELNARHHLSNDHVFKLFDKAFKYMLSISVMVCIGTVVIAKALIEMLYGPSFEKTTLVLILLGIAVIPSYLRYMFGNTLIAVNLQKKETMIAASRSGFNVVANLALIPFYGYIGATIATVATDYFSIVFYFIILKKQGLVRISQLRFIYKPFLAAGFVIPVFFLIRHYHGVIQFFILIGVYIIAVFALRIFERDEIVMIRKYAQSIFKKNQTTPPRLKDSQ